MGRTNESSWQHEGKARRGRTSIIMSRPSFCFFLPRCGAHFRSTNRARGQEHSAPSQVEVLSRSPRSPPESTLQSAVPVAPASRCHAARTLLALCPSATLLCHDSCWQFINCPLGLNSRNGGLAPGPSVLSTVGRVDGSGGSGGPCCSSLAGPQVPPPPCGPCCPCSTAYSAHPRPLVPVFRRWRASRL